MTHRDREIITQIMLALELVMAENGGINKRLDQLEAAKGLQQEEPHPTKQKIGFV